MIGTGIAGIFFLAFFAMMGTGFNIVRGGRENLRATQIILNRLEGLRLFTWEQLIYSNSFAPTNFTELYYPSGTNNQGITYTGTMRVTTPTMSPAATYSTNMMKQVTIQLSWRSAGVNHTRSMSTYVSKYGAQNYIFAN